MRSKNQRNYMYDRVTNKGNMNDCSEIKMFHIVKRKLHLSKYKASGKIHKVELMFCRLNKDSYKVGK